MPIRTIATHMLASLLLGLSLFTTTMAMAQDATSFDVAEFNKILDAINQANIPDNVKDRLFRDLRTSMIENVRLADIPENVKRTLIKDLQTTSRE